MDDSLFDLLKPQVPHQNDEQSTRDYLERLTTLSLEGLSKSEVESLEYETSSITRSLQALAKRSYKSLDLAVTSLQQLQGITPQLLTGSAAIQKTIPSLDTAANRFAEKYAHPQENVVLARRRQALRMSENVDRLSDVLELPALLATAIAASSPSSTANPGTSSSASSNYAAALDLYGHIKRLQRLHPDSRIVESIGKDAEEAMKTMTSNLMTVLRSNSLKLASAMRLIGLLRRVAPELDDPPVSQKVFASAQSEGSLGALFLVCRLANLNSTLDALDPLRELADQETTDRMRSTNDPDAMNSWAAGQQTERYLKRYIEIFREQCFAIVSMYKNIFPASLQGPAASNSKNGQSAEYQPNALANVAQVPSLPKRVEQDLTLPGDLLQNMPPALCTFTIHLVETLTNTLEEYMPNVQDSGSRDSLLTQVLYCAGSLGRLGGDFSMMLASLDLKLGSDSRLQSGDQNLFDMPGIPEWTDAMRKHKVQAGRLELLANAAGRDRNMPLRSPASAS